MLGALQNLGMVAIVGVGFVAFVLLLYGIGWITTRGWRDRKPTDEERALQRVAWHEEDVRRLMESGRRLREWQDGSTTATNARDTVATVAAIVPARYSFGEWVRISLAVAFLAFLAYFALPAIALEIWRGISWIGAMTLSVFASVIISGLILTIGLVPAYAGYLLYSKLSRRHQGA